MPTAADTWLAHTSPTHTGSVIWTLVNIPARVNIPESSDPYITHHTCHGIFLSMAAKAVITSRHGINVPACNHADIAKANKASDSRLHVSDQAISHSLLHTQPCPTDRNTSQEVRCWYLYLQADLQQVEVTWHTHSDDTAFFVYFPWAFTRWLDGLAAFKTRCFTCFISTLLPTLLDLMKPDLTKCSKHSFM